MGVSYWEYQSAIFTPLRWVVFDGRHASLRIFVAGVRKRPRQKKGPISDNDEVYVLINEELPDSAPKYYSKANYMDGGIAGGYLLI